MSVGTRSETISRRPLWSSSLMSLRNTNLQASKPDPTVSISLGCSNIASWSEIGRPNENVGDFARADAVFVGLLAAHWLRFELPLPSRVRLQLAESIATDFRYPRTLARLPPARVAGEGGVAGRGERRVGVVGGSGAVVASGRSGGSRRVRREVEWWHG